MANWIWYGQGTDLIDDWTTATFKVMLTTSSYTPNQDTHDFRDDVTNEVTGTGYSAGGVTVAGKTRTYDATSNERRYVMGNNVWGPGATINGVNSPRVAVLYKSLGGAASADPLIAYAVLDADTPVTNGTLTLTNNSTATLKITASAT